MNEIRMKAAVVHRHGDPSVLEIGEVERPVPRHGEVRVRNAAAGVNFIDLMIRSGQIPSVMRPSSPFVLGVEGSGVIDEVGPGVSCFALGQRVAWFGPIGSGGYGVYSVLREEHVASIPEPLSCVDAAGLLVAGVTAWHLVHHRTRLEKGAAVLVHAAAGGVGGAVLQIAHAAGLRVAALATAQKLETCRALGAEIALDRNDPERFERLRSWAGPAGVAATFNSVGGDTVSRDLDLLGPSGQLVLYGFLDGLPEERLGETFASRWSKSLSVIASDIYTLASQRPDVFARTLQRVIDECVEGRLRARVDTVLPLEQAGEAHILLERRAVSGKIVLTHGSE